MTSIFNTNLEYPRRHVWCKFSDSSPTLRQVIAQTSQISYNSESKWPKWPWRSRSMTSIFITNLEYPMMHLCWFQLKSVTSYPADKVKFMDGQTQATTIPLRPERQGVKNKMFNVFWLQPYAWTVDSVCVQFLDPNVFGRLYSTTVLNIIFPEVICVFSHLFMSDDCL